MKSKTVYSGTHRDIPFDIHHRAPEERGTHFGDHFPSGSWTFYIFLHEVKCTDFDAVWLPDELKEWSAGGRKYVSHDYNREPLGSVDMHCGATYYRKHGHTEGFRCVELGCDYQHYWDEGHWYDAESVERDAIQAIDSCYALGLIRAEETAPKTAEASTPVTVES